MTVALFLSVLVIATCGLVYELVAGTLASYLLGDSVFQFSTVIGTYLSAMGLGSYLSRHIAKGLVRRFIEVEILVGLTGGFAAAGLMLAHAYGLPFRVCLYGAVVGIGALIGLEIPLLIRILQDRVSLRHLISQVLTLDYIGALVASVLFPLVLVPKLGLLRSSFAFGLANVGVAYIGIRLFRDSLPSVRSLSFLAGGAAVALSAGLVGAQRITSFAENQLYADEIVYAKSTPYQRIVLTQWRDDLRLYLNANLQFSSTDEHRYHESLVHPALAGVADPSAVLVLGGGDGLAVREILKDTQVQRITLVDLDPEMTNLFRHYAPLVRLNRNSLNDRRVTVVNKDAFQWVEENRDFYDVIVIDLPDPSNYSVGKLYTTAFYRMAARRLRAHGLLVVQATSPMFARESFWCIERSIAEAGLQTTPYHAYVPSFGEWGFVIGAREPYRKQRPFASGLRFLNDAVFATLFEFPPDMGRLSPPPNRLDDQRLVAIHEKEWDRITK